MRDGGDVQFFRLAGGEKIAHLAALLKWSIHSLPLPISTVCNSNAVLWSPLKPEGGDGCLLLVMMPQARLIVSHLVLLRRDTRYEIRYAWKKRLEIVTRRGSRGIVPVE